MIPRMKQLFLALVTSALLLAVTQAEEKNDDTDSSSNLTPTAERPPNMANPVKPDWLPQRHGK
jgi:hypothetical protein